MSQVVARLDGMVEAERDRHARGAGAVWDLTSDGMGGPSLTLSLRDGSGFVQDRFDISELADEERAATRVRRLFDELARSPRRVGVSIPDGTYTPAELEKLRHAINEDPVALAGHPRLRNEIRFDETGRFVVRDFTVEVDQSAAEAVRRAVKVAGFAVDQRGGLAGRPDVDIAVGRLVDQHLRDPEAPPRLVVWFRLDDPNRIHLLEVGDDVADPGDGSLQGISLGAGTAVPGARSIVIYLASPAEIHKAFEVNPDHPAVIALAQRSGRLLHPADDWPSVDQEFPEFANHPSATGR